MRQSRPSLEVFSRRDDWAPRIAFAGEAIDLWSIDVTLNVDEIY